jgi:hypothetical protein
MFRVWEWLGRSEMSKPEFQGHSIDIERRVKITCMPILYRALKPVYVHYAVSTSLVLQ